MDFSFSAGELAFADEARRWLDTNLPAAWRRDHCWTRVEDPMWIEVARAWQRKLFEGGWAAISWPREYGGRGATVVERWFFDQALDQVGAPRPPAQSYVDLIGPAILQHGSEEQRRRFLSTMVNGELLWCQGFSEPGAGSDLGSLRCRAERRGDEYVVNGQKVWTSNADIADWCFLLCRTEPDAPKHKGISLLLIDMKTPGITVRPLKQMTDDDEFCEVFFEDVRVPAANLLGAPGAGWNIAMGIVAHERGPMWTFVFQRKIRRSLSQLLQPACTREPRLGDPASASAAQAPLEVEILASPGSGG
jgi:alkylation response protein AidB-like acyl-CoA dehydrogenase